MLDAQSVGTTLLLVTATATARTGVMAIRYHGNNSYAKGIAAESKVTRPIKNTSEECETPITSADNEVEELSEEAAVPNRLSDN